MSNLLQHSKHFFKANLSLCLKNNRPTSLRNLDVSFRTRTILSTNSFRCVKSRHYHTKGILYNTTSEVINVQRKGHSILTPILIRKFHTSGRKDAFPPLVWVVIAYGGKITAALTGRRWRQWLKAQPKDVRRKYCIKITQVFAAVSAVVMSCLTMYYYSHIQEVPVTGRKRFISMTREQYMKVAEYESENFVEQFKENLVTNTHPVYDTVAKIVRDIIAGNKDFPGMENMRWKIFVVKSKEKNAFVLPNGHIFVYTGIMEFMDNTDQLAVVLGHEMSHALLLHAAEQLSYAQFLDVIIIGTMAAIWLFLPNDGVAFITNWFYNKVMALSIQMPYSRTLEKEADRVGLQLAAKACYDIREGPVFWNKMSISGDIKSENVPEFLSTHPSNAARVKTLNELVPKAIQMRESCSCPRLPEVDPRKRSEVMREIADNFLTAQAAKANLTHVKTHRGSRRALKPEDKS